MFLELFFSYQCSLLFQEKSQHGAAAFSTKLRSPQCAAAYSPRIAAERPAAKPSVVAAQSKAAPNPGHAVFEKGRRDGHDQPNQRHSEALSHVSHVSVAAAAAERVLNAVGRIIQQTHGDRQVTFRDL